MSSDLKNINVSICTVLFIVFIYLLYMNLTIDSTNTRKLDNIICHKEVLHKLPKIKDVDKLVIESVIEDYWRKRSMNKSNCGKIWNEIKGGVLRGIIGGVIVGGGMSGAISGAIVFGSMSGLMKAYNLSHGKMIYLSNIKHT